MTTPANRRTFPKATGWLLGWIALMWVGGLGYRAVLPDRLASGQCEGIGFGCTLTPHDGATLLMLIIGLPITLGALVIGIPWILAWHRRWPPWLVGSTGFAGGALAALLFLYVSGLFG